MGIRVARQKPRHWLAALAHKLSRLVPHERKLDFLLDLEWIAARQAHESACSLGLARHTRNDFLLNSIRPGERVLDLGSADGYVTSTIDAKVVGIDHNPAMVEAARKAHPALEFVCADAKTYLKTAEPFDVLILSHVLEHLDEPEDFLRSVAPKFMRIYVEVPDFDAHLLNQVRVRRGLQLVYQDDDHVSEFDRRELEAMLARCGLEVIDREFIHGFMRYWVRPA